MSICILENVSPGDLHSFCAKGLPFLAKSAISKWPAAQLWRPEYLIRKVGHRDISAWQSNDVIFGTHPSMGQPSKKIKIRAADGIASVFSDNRNTSTPRLYIAGLPFMETVPELCPDVELPAWLMARPRKRVNLWIGSAHNTSPFHYDAEDNIFAQVYGSKRIKLYPPGRLSNFYPFSVRKHRQLSPINPDAPDLKTYPRFARCVGTEVTVHAGDILFIPARWWHYVVAIDHNISLNTFWPTSWWRVAKHRIRRAQLWVDELIDHVWPIRS